MRTRRANLLGVLLCLSAALPVHAQIFQPKTIQFAGVPDYTDAELLATAGLKVGDTLDNAAMNAHAQKLMDTGMFGGLTFKFDGADLIFALTPSPDTVPARFENLPFPAGKELDDALHAAVPLYHGKVSQQAGTCESVRVALESYLAVKKLPATVQATPVIAGSKITAISYAIVAPPILVGDLQTQGAVLALDPAARTLLTKLSGGPYSVTGSPEQIERELTGYYDEQGYLQAEVRATALAKPLIAADAVRVPFRVALNPGVQYRLAGITLGPGLLVSQAEFDKQSQVKPGTVADGAHVRANWEFVARQYHNKGYMRAKVAPEAHFDKAAGTVAYTVSAEPGVQYTMGKLAIDGVTDELRAAIVAAWPMPAGALFNEGAIRGIIATHGVHPALEAVFAQVNVHYNMVLNDDTKTVDVTMRLEKKP